MLGVDSPVAEICSVSQCISAGPPDWITRWRHNDLGFYDTEAAAFQVVDHNLAAYDLYAYRLVPIRCLDGVSQPLTITSQAKPIPETYERLGYDVVTKSSSDFFECSPLSCNGAAQVFAVNQHCLLDDGAAAYGTLLAMSVESGYEPGPYYLFEVYRKRKPIAA